MEPYQQPEEDVRAIVTLLTNMMASVQVELLDNTDLINIEQNNLTVHSLLMLEQWVQGNDSFAVAYNKYKQHTQQFIPKSPDIDKMTAMRCHMLQLAAASILAREGAIASPP